MEAEVGVMGEEGAGEAQQERKGGEREGVSEETRKGEGG